MNATETKIVDKILGEIEKADLAVDRNPLIDHLFGFLGAVEKRIQLSAPTLEAEAKGVVAEVETAAEKLVTKVESIV